MVKKKKLVIITLSIMVVTILSIVTYNLSLNKEVIINEYKEKSNNNKLISMLLETSFGSGKYEETSTNAWPDGYSLNKNLSKCENGSELLYNEEKNTISVKTNKTDRCYVYFDKIPDFSVNTTYKGAAGMPTTVGASANLNCVDANGDYDYLKNRLEISSVSGKRPYCTLDFSERSSKRYLNTYIKNTLVGTTQGDGKVVHEQISIPVNPTNFTKYQPILRSGDSYTLSNNEYTITLTPGTNDVYQTYEFNVSEAGYYRFCVSIPKYNSSSYATEFRIQTGVPNARNYNALYYASNKDVNSCDSIFYMTSSDKLQLSAYHRANSGYNGAAKFWLEKTNDRSTVDTGYRYEGKNPNNYVLFNNELWRIVGVFDSDSHGIEGKYLTKIIRNQSIGNLVAGESYSKNMGDINPLLNKYYLEKLDGTNSDYCYIDQGHIKGNCNYKLIGINKSYRNMIEEVKWYSGGTGNDNITGSAIYGFERWKNSDRKFNLVYSYGFCLDDECDDYISYDKHKIGLIYASDYAFASLADSCPRDTRMSYYYNDGCFNKNWIYNGEEQFTYTNSPLSQNDVYRIHNNGASYVDFSYGWIGRSTFPAAYLNENVYIISGTGTKTDPYILGM